VFRRPPHFTVLLAPGRDGSASRRSLDSVEVQIWSAWEVRLLGDAPDQTTLDRGLRRQIHAAPRESGETVMATAARAVAGLGETEIVLFLPHDVILHPEALMHVAFAARADPLVDLLYWDDDVLVAGDGEHKDPRFRPSWSPDALLSHFYLGGSFAIRNRVLLRHPPRTDLGDATWWNVVLRAGIETERVIRIPRVLSHLPRREDGPGEDGLRMIREHLTQAVGDEAEASQVGKAVRVRWRLREWPSVTVIIPTRHNRPLLTRALASIARAGYPNLDVIVVDNGERSEDNEAWYRDNGHGLDLRVTWWDQPFNYSAVNNRAAAEARGEVLVFLNDDTESHDASWLEELVGWAVQPGVGEVGMQLVGPDGRIQHAGVIVGLNGFADHLFAGAQPGDMTLLGPVTSYRNVLAVTAACVAIRRSTFEEVGGFDELFVLCGSDVALGLSLHHRGLRNVCTPYGGMTHLESATRGTYIPPQDFPTSYWRYQTVLHSGDPFFSPNLSLKSTVPQLRHAGEPSSLDAIAEPLGRRFTVFRQRMDPAEMHQMARRLVVDRGTRELVQRQHAEAADPFEVRTVNWFLPGIDSPFYGGMNTILRIVDNLQSVHGVRNRLVMEAGGSEGFMRAAVAAAFPRLRDIEIHLAPEFTPEFVAGLPYADAGIATLWTTAYTVATAPNLRRRFYLVQDFEPIFYPASTMFALAEQTYRMGLYAICNTENLLRIYRDNYHGSGMSFQPAVDRSVFHAKGRRVRGPDDPVTLFVYARPGHWRNCWEIASTALVKAREQLGDRLRIVTAGSWAFDDSNPLEASAMRHLGLLEYRATGDLYRSSDIGLTLTVSAHPSYLPLEVMACGGAVIAFDNPDGHWLLRSGENCLLTEMSATSVTEAIVRLVEDESLRTRLAAAGLANIDAHHSDWPAALSGVYDYLCDPEGRAMTAGHRPVADLTSAF
jgi:GT2 family glycosyltransferase/glycosyltransferase involved in cell wall biosynthesis